MFQIAHYTSSNEFLIRSADEKILSYHQSNGGDLDLALGFSTSFTIFITGIDSNSCVFKSRLERNGTFEYVSIKLTYKMFCWILGVPTKQNIACKALECITSKEKISMGTNS